MNNGWPMVPLGELLSRSDDQIELLPDETYRQITVRLWGNGAVERGKVVGTQIAAERQAVVRSGQFILSRIDARNGAAAIVPPELDGAVVSNDFPVFKLNEQKLLPGFIDWFSKTRTFIELCKQASEGTTNRVRLKEDRFLATQIPLPPLPEQQRIVGRIEELAAKVEEAKGLVCQTREDATLLCRSILFSNPDRCTPTRMDRLLVLREPDVAVIPDTHYRFAGVYCFGRGLFKGEERSGLDFSYKVLTRLRTGDFLYPKLMAWEGAFALVPEAFEGLHVSPEFPVFTVNQGVVLPETLEVYFGMPSVWEEVAGKSTGTNVRRRRLHPTRLLVHEMPLPPLSIQQTVRRVKQRLSHMQLARDTTARHLDALLPSILDKAFRGELGRTDATHPHQGDTEP